MRKWMPGLLYIMFLLIASGTLLGIIWPLVRSDQGPALSPGRALLIAASVLLIILPFGIELLRRNKDKKLRGSPRYLYSSRRPRRFVLVLIVLALLLASVVLEFAYAPSSTAVWPTYMFIVILTTSVMRFVLTDGLYENGVLRWGMFCSWDNVREFTVEDGKKSTRLTLVTMDQPGNLELERPLSIRLTQGERDEIVGFVREKVEALKNRS